MKIEDLIIVVRCGVYDQGVVGICENVYNAMAVAEAAAAEEDDLYHTFDLRKASSSGKFDHIIRFLGQDRSRFRDLGDKRVWKEVE